MLHPNVQVRTLQKMAKGTNLNAYSSNSGALKGMRSFFFVFSQFVFNFSFVFFFYFSHLVTVLFIQVRCWSCSCNPISASLIKQSQSSQKRSSCSLTRGRVAWVTPFFFSTPVRISVLVLIFVRGGFLKYNPLYFYGLSSSCRVNVQLQPLEEGETLRGEMGGWPTAVVVGWVYWGRMPASHSLEQWEDMESTADSRYSFLALA